MLRTVQRRVLELWTWARSNRFEAGLIALLLIVSVAAHATNMFQFPYYENDEATYTSRAWTFVTDGRLDVYTYRYDHAPLGWIILGFWQIVSGGTLLFGSLLESGRVFMLLLHIGSTLLVYILGKRFSGGSKLAATVAVAFFSLSPVAIYFQRRILLDNIMTFLLLLSLYYATHSHQRLKHFVLSGLTLGMAVLTKLNAVFFAPAILLIIWIRAHRQHRAHAVTYWLAVMGIVIGSFFLYALLKGELFPAPVGPDGNPTHVSVVDTFALQLGRGDFAWPWEAKSSFIQNIRSWLLKDWSILTFGALSTIGISIVGVRWRKKQPYVLILALLILLYVAFLARGKVVLDLYIVPLIPLLALAIGVAVELLYRVVLKMRLQRAAFVVLLIVSSISLAVVLPNKHYSQDEVTNQLNAVSWVQQHVPEGAVIAADNYIYPYLAQEDGYKNVSYFFTAEYDPEVRKLYSNDWRNIEYLVLTHEIVKQVKAGTVPRMKQVLDHAVLLADYRQGTSSYIDLPNYISTNGDWVQIYQIKNRNDIVLQDSWRHFKDTFIIDYGQVIDITNNSLSTSSSQAQAMLRAISMGDGDMFNGLWQWSKDHLRYRTNDKLLSWKWERGTDGAYKLTDSNTVCDADQLIAYALFQADEKWPNQGYGQEAVVHANDWWRECVFERGGKLYVDSSADGSLDDKLINPGYFRPAAYRYLADKLPQLPWGVLINNGYELLDRMWASYNTIPNWTLLKLDGSFATATPLVGTAANEFGYDALQLVPSLSEDFILSGSEPAGKLLAQLQPKTTDFVTAAKSGPPSVMSVLLEQVLRETIAQQQYEKIVYGTYNAEHGFWLDSNNFRDQVWFWQWHVLQGKLPPGMQVTLK